MAEPKSPITYFALRRLQVGDGYREPGDLVPEAVTWHMLPAYLRAGDLAPVLTASLPANLRTQFAEWESTNMPDENETHEAMTVPSIQMGQGNDGIGSQVGPDDEAGKKHLEDTPEAKAALDDIVKATDESNEQYRESLKENPAATDPKETEAALATIKDDDDSTPKKATHGNVPVDGKPAQRNPGSTKDGDEEDIPPYDEWTREELLAETVNRKLDVSKKATKAELVSALEDDDS